MGRIIVIGWDGATWDLLQPWVAAGKLPHLDALLERAAWGALHSTIQPLTAVAWTSFQTGCNPGKHGLFDFVHPRPGSYGVRLVSRQDRQVPDLWQLLTRHGKRLAAVNVPMLVPVERVNGILVGGIDAPSLGQRTVFPSSFIGELRELVPNYRIAASERSLPAWSAALREMVDGRRDLLLHLLAREAWDVLMVVFSATDIVQHIFWGHMQRGEAPYAEEIFHIYRACDAVLGELLGQLRGEDTLVLMSDHGAGPLSGAIHLNAYLEAGGFLKRQRSHSVGLGSVLRVGKRYLPAPVRAWLRSRFGDVRDQVESQLVSSAYDWTRTRVYSVGSYGNLYFNLQGREPEGIVSPAEIDGLVAEVTEHLLALADPVTGVKPVRRVWRREDLYHGPALSQAPDLIVEWADLSYEVRTRFGSDGQAVFERTMPLNDLAPETVLTATHRMEGIVAAVGPHVRAGKVDGAQIIDLAPTLLHLLDLPVPAHMDGTVLKWLTAGLDSPRFHNVEDVFGESPPPLSDAEAAEVEERLRNLGYLG